VVLRVLLHKVLRFELIVELVQLEVVLLLSDAVEMFD
jgi:hypothetical protein